MVVLDLASGVLVIVAHVVLHLDLFVLEGLAVWLAQQGFLCYRQFQCRWSSICHSCLSMFTDLVPVMLITICIAKRFFFSLLVLYNILLLINCYLDNNTTECHSGSMSDNRDLTEVFHQFLDISNPHEYA